MASLKEIQQNLALIPEFSGADSNNRTYELTRFIGTADSVYNMLTKDEDKKKFSELVKFRLTGDAYARVINRQIGDYEELKAVLNNMYTKIFTLDELERKFINIRQSYGETIRNYGYRVMEALENYKTGYQLKYKKNKIDETYTQHLDNNAIQAFKRGLSNNILREKVATIKVKNLDEIINETESIDRMLEMTNGLEATMPPQNQYYNYRNQRNENQQSWRRIICYFCQKQGHTYNVCRARLGNAQFATSNVNYRNQINTQPMQQTNYSQFRPPMQRVGYSQYRPTTQQAEYGYNNQSTSRNNQQPKYCSHCKTTTSHTFDECRSKYFTNKNHNTSDHPRDRGIPGNKELEEKFNKMRISQMRTQQTIPRNSQTNNQMSENSNGSSQL